MAAVAAGPDTRDSLVSSSSPHTVSSVSPPQRGARSKVLLTSQENCRNNIVLAEGREIYFITDYNVQKYLNQKVPGHNLSELLIKA